MYPYKHILLATDLSGNCHAMAEQAMNLAKTYGAQLSLVHTIEPIPAYGYPGFEDLQSPLIDSAKEQLAALAKELHIPADRTHLEFGAVKTEIIKVANELKVDLVVIGSHGRHGLSRILGSGASAIIHGVECDVLTARCAKE